MRLWAAASALALLQAMAGPARSAEPARAESPAEAPPLYPVKAGRSWGYMDRSGALKVPARLDEAGEFSDGLAAARAGGAWGYLDSSGAWAIAPRFKAAEPFSEGLAPVGNGVRFGAVDPSGRFVIEPRFDKMRPFIAGLAAVEVNGRWGFVDRAGKVRVPIEYDRVGRLPAEGPVALKRREKCSFHDPRKPIRPAPLYDDCGMFREGLAAVRLAGRWGFIREDGSFAIPCRFDGVWGFSEGLAAARQDGLWGFVDARGRWAVRPVFARVGMLFSEGLVEAAPGRLFGYIDRAGRLVVPPRFERAQPFTGGLARVRLADRDGYISRSGLYVWHPLKGFGRSVAALLTLLLAAALLPGAGAHGLGRAACLKIERAASQDEKLAVFHRLQAWLAAMQLVYVAVFIGGVALAGSLTGDTASQMATLVLNYTGWLGAAQFHAVAVLCAAAVLAAYFGGFVLVQSAVYRADRLVRDTGWTLWEFVAANVRMLAIMILPMLAWIALVGVLPDDPYAFFAALIAFLFSVYALAPLWIRHIWKARPLPDGEVRRSLAALSGRAGVQFRGMWVWSSAHAKAANAMVSGILPFYRHVFLTDFLIERLAPAEIAAIIGHEIGHIKKRHLLAYMGSALAYGVVAVGLGWAASRVRWLAGLPDWAGFALGLALLVAYLLLVFGTLSRRFERDADRYAAELTGDPGAMISALEKLAQLGGAPRRWAGWVEALQTHPSFGRRVEALRGLPPRVAAAAGRAGRADEEPRP